MGIMPLETPVHPTDTSYVQEEEEEEENEQ